MAAVFWLGVVGCAVLLALVAGVVYATVSDPGEYPDVRSEPAHLGGASHDGFHDWGGGDHVFDGDLFD